MATKSLLPYKPDMSQLYGSDLLTDITLKLKNGKIRAHRAVLAVASPYFKSYFEDDHEKYNPQSAINMHDKNPIAVRAMVCFCYTGSFERFEKSPTSPGAHSNADSTADPSTNTDISSNSDPLFNLYLYIDLCMIGHEYQIESLVEQTERSTAIFIGKSFTHSKAGEILGLIQEYFKSRILVRQCAANMVLRSISRARRGSKARQVYLQEMKNYPTVLEMLLNFANTRR